MPLYLGNKLVSGQTRPIDGAVAQGSNNLITSGAVKTYVDDIVDDLATQKQLNEAISGIQVPVQSVNGKTGAVQLVASDIGAATVAQVQAAQNSADSKVPNTRKVNNKQLNADITLTAADVGAATTAQVETAQNTANSKASTVTYTVSVPASWTASNNYYYKDVSVNGILATDNPVPGVNPGTDNAANVVYAENFGKIFRITTSANSIRLWATEDITSALPIQLKVVR